MSRRIARLAAHVFAAGLIAACSGKTDAPPAPPPPKVGVEVAHAASVPLTGQLVGRLEATRTAEVRARVPGIVQRRVYVEGTDVREGEPLFTIDPAPLDAALRNREAALAQVRASAANATAKARRYQELSGRGVIARQDVEDAVAAERTALAAVKAAEADVEVARLNRGYASVTAPISGRAGRALVTEGALVGQGEATPLTTIEQIDPIYADFSQSVAEVNALREAQASGKLKLAAPDQIEVQVALDDGKPYPHTGALSFADLAVDPKTGAVSLRATLPNPEHRLLPGMFVKVLLTQGELASAFLVPTRAVQRDPQGAYVLVVDAENKAQLKRVELAELRGANWVVTGGLSEGDRYIVGGLQQARAGSPVQAVPQAELDQPAPAPAADASKK